MGSTRPRRPNVLIFMSDDQGPWALRCAGTPELRTPALDQLAAEGMRFDRFFCASPVCSPARASFLTGRMPSQHGVHDWIKSGNIQVAEGVTWSGADRPIQYLEGLTGFTEVLAANGYVCGLSGKWHLGASGTPQQGHRFWCAHSLGGGSYTDYLVFDNGPELSPRTQYVTDLFTDRALAFLDQYGSGPDPFCLSVHYTAPHAPWRRQEQPAAIWDEYAAMSFPSLPVLPAHPWSGWDPTPEQRHETVTGYFTTITAMDQAIGRILARIDGLGIRDRTLVVFTSDNGYSVGHHGILGKGNGTSPVNMYEEAVRVPFIARYPGLVPAGRVNTDLLSHYDFMPTLLDLVGVELPAPAASGSGPGLAGVQALPGRSFLPALRGAADSSRQQVVVCEEYGPARMIRECQWKYVHRYPYGPHELYNLVEDPGETVNRAADPGCAETVRCYRARLGEWFGRHVDPALDGAREPVTGRGQIDRVGPGGQGRVAFL